ncbi:MAG TPA: DUF3604 domain-containing protein [Candidatus Binatia bacterium]|nr:DUF3604 domain-containing protein [Candidatus Binatia bacterium]
MSRIKWAGAIVVLLVVGVVGYVAGAWLRLYGEHEGPGQIAGTRVPAPVVEARAGTQATAAKALTVGQPKQILFGDLHVHTTFSTDAFLWSLPMMQGEGAHPLADACDYARFCSALDFWSINDHAEASTPRRWQETKEAIRQCNAVAGHDPNNPDVVVFTGWEWSQVGRTPADHYGHKNVIFRGLADDEVPTRPIGAAGIATDGLRSAVGQMSPAAALADFRNRQRYYNFIEFMREVRDVPLCPSGVNSRALPRDCYESAATPRELFDKLDQWGFDAIVIPHGNTWGFYSPPGITWDKQLTGEMNDPQKQFLIEIMSGHGNSEEYRDWHEVVFDPDGEPHCPEPTQNYLPSCWRAGEIIDQRCRKAGLDASECANRAAEARQRYAESGVPAHWTVPGAEFEEWLDSGQCKDCFIPSFNYRPGGSTQYALAISNFDDPTHPKRFHFGILASSDNHRARPGTGYKEFDRHETTESHGPRDATWLRRINGAQAAPEPRSTVLNIEQLAKHGFNALEAERQTSFFMTGGLVAVHANGRSRDEIWNALKRKEVYGTSGDRILLWFNLLNAPGPSESATTVPMGGETKMSRAPRFEVRAVGAFKQKPGCPDYSMTALNPERLNHLCKGECYNPSDERKRITRIEVVRIRPQTTPGEPVARLIEDKWRVIPCEPSEAGCAVQFEDPDFVASGRPAVYYARAIEEPSPAVNAGQLRCKYDESGRCIDVHPCYGDYRTAKSDDCLTTIEERAWSSPIYIDPS